MNPGFGRPLQLLRGEVDQFCCQCTCVMTFQHINSGAMSLDVVQS